MRSLKAIYQEALKSDSQRKRFNELSKMFLPSSGEPTEIVDQCLIRLASLYSAGGINCGRSARSVILTQIRVWLGGGQLEKAKTALAILLAMYHDIDYINAQRWFDGFKVESINDIPLEDRIYLCEAARIFEVDSLPEMSDWPAQAIVDLINS